MIPPTPDRRGDASRRATWPLRAMAVVLLALGIFPMAELLRMANAQTWWPRALFAWLVWTPCILGAALALAWRWPARCTALIAWAKARLLAPSPTRFAVGVGAAACLLAIAIGWLMFDGYGSTIDEMSQLWQARLLLSGRLSAMPELHDEFFSTAQTVTLNGRWFPHFPIGGPLLQTLGLLLHAPWLINPLLGGIAAVAVYRFAAAAGDELEARAVALLFVTSPFVLTISGSRFDHAGTIAAVWLALAALPQWLAAESEARTHRAAALVGAGLGTAILIRPYDGIVATLVVGAFQLVTVRQDGRRWRALLTQTAVASIPLIILLSVNHALTGSATTFAYDAVNGAEHRPGFHVSPLGFEHTPRIGLFRVSTYLMRINALLLGWPVPILVLVVLVLATQARSTRWDRLAMGFLAATLVAYLLYWGDGSFHGPRFLYVATPVFLFYVVRFPAALRDNLPHPTTRLAASLLIPMWVAAAWLSPEGRFAPYSAWAITGGAWKPEPVSHAIIDTVRQRHLSNAVVFVSDGWNARLTARLRKLRIPPFHAQDLAIHHDNCRLQRALDVAERAAAPIGVQSAYVLAVADQMEEVPRTDTRLACPWDSANESSQGADFSWMLALNTVDSTGRLAGDVVFARDFGERNELLRDRFADRDWYVARVLHHDGRLGVTLEPIVRPVMRSAARR